MSYYTAVNTVRNDKYGKCIWESEGFSVYAWSGLLHLYKGDIQLAELISGRKGLKKYHKDDYQAWIQSVKKKDMAKAKKIRKQAEEALQDADLIEGIWKAP